MKKSLLLIIAALFAFIACKPSAPKTVSGTIFDATMNTLTITNDAGEKFYFSTTDADKTEANGLSIGAKAEVFYTGDLNTTGENNITVATKVIAAPISIVGSWTQPIPGMEGIQGFSLEDGGVASSINMSTLVYNSWTQNNDSLYLSGQSLGNGETITFNESFYIQLLNADSLIIVSKDTVAQSFSRVK